MGLSLEGAALLRFGLVDKKARPDLPRRFEVLLQPRSLLVFADEAYELYVHWIDHEVEDVTVDGLVVPRAPRRTSLTMRRLASVQSHSHEAVSNEHHAARAAQWAWWDSQLS